MEEYFNNIKKYNFWDEATPDLGFLRTDYTQKIISYLSNRLVKVLIGQRRTGKSFILRQLINYLIDKGVKKITFCMSIKSTPI